MLQLSHEAKDLLRSFTAGDPSALQRLRESHPRAERGSQLRLSDAQLVLAREYGFSSWPKLKRHVEGLRGVDERVDRLRKSFAAADHDTRERLLSGVHTRIRFQDYDPDATQLSERDARLVVANEEGYAFWSKYESYLYLDPTVQQVIAAARRGELATMVGLLRADPAAANQRWVRGHTPEQIPNDSIPLDCVSEGVFYGTNTQRNDYQLARALIRAGADVDVDNGGPLKTAVSYYAPGAVRALLEAGAAVDSPEGNGMPMAYALGFGFSDIAELLADHGAQLDLRFAAGLGRLDLVKSFVNVDGSLSPDAGRLADPYENWFRCERTRANVLCQALNFACVHLRMEVADYLLELGADVNQEVPGLNQLGGTVLHALTAGVPAGASRDSHADDDRRIPVIRLLLQHGADVTLQDSRFHSTPLGWADHHGSQRIFDLLAPMAGVHDAVRFCLLDRLQVLLRTEPALADSRDSVGPTPLQHLDAGHPHALEAVEILIRFGAQPNLRDPADKALVQRLVAAGRFEVVSALRRAAAADIPR